MFDWIFAFFHLFLLLAVVLYAFYSLLQGNYLRFMAILVLLTGYYFLVLHKAVKKEIQRKREKRS
jgi:4-hydroxybenzoate polyprenyltransferase